MKQTDAPAQGWEKVGYLFPRLVTSSKTAFL